VTSASIFGSFIGNVREESMKSLMKLEEDASAHASSGSGSEFDPFDQDSLEGSEL